MKLLKLVYIVPVLLGIWGAAFSQMDTQQAPEERREFNFQFRIGQTPPQMVLMDMGSYESIIGTINPEITNIMSKYRVQIQKIYQDSRKNRNILEIKRKQLVLVIQSLVKRYEKNKTLGKELVGSLRDLYAIQTEIQNVNQDAISQIEKLNAKRELELEAANDAWLKRMDSDSAELDRFIQTLRVNFLIPPPADQ